ncbi:MAG: aminoglycoside phosphotransferase [Cytophagales bacterium CG18_big_fil_WC_8_21_14_2_50_42_9]|nr:MAG: aminoglycoside phosphotransferase [Cytophagales bacterium CG18_big_fil_WC_8_21_14_2_50_42_9]
MTDFSVISSILSSLDIAKFVRDKYSLTASTTCKLLKTGINHTYRIDSKNESFIFRIYSYNWRTKEEITEELNLLQLLKKNNISVSYPIADTSENFIQSIKAPEGLRFAVLFSFAKGHKILNYRKETHFEVGKLMAQIHTLTKGLEQKRINYTPDTLLNQSLENIREFLGDETDEMQFLIVTRPLLEKELLNANNQNLRKGIVHLDIWFDNLNISDKNEITLFDFDFCGNGWLCLDIAYYVLQLNSTEKDEIELAEKLEAFYSGYQTVEKISDVERRLIPILGVCLYYFYLGIQCSRFDNWSNTFLNEVYLKRFITILIKNYYEKTKQNKICA